MIISRVRQICGMTAAAFLLAVTAGCSSSTPTAVSTSSPAAIATAGAGAETSAAEAMTSTAGGAQQAKTAGPCALLTTAQIDAAAGGHAAAGALDDTAIPAGSKCTWDIAASPLQTSTMKSASIDPTLGVFYGANPTLDQFNATEKALKGPVPVSGLGDVAFYDPNLSVASIWAKNKEVDVQFTVIGTDAQAAKIKTTVVALAKTVVANL